MTIEEAIKWIETKKSLDLRTKDGQAMSHALTALQQMHKEPKWISVEDRLPEKEKLVLCFDATFGVQIAKRWLWTNYKECWATNSAMPLERITHWMPLPKPPEQDESCEHSPIKSKCPICND